jgi:Family of unknown function (DUF6448)
MSRQHLVRRLCSTLTAAMVLFIVSSTASAHCDGMDGPVVKAARRALESHDANLVLIWVQKKDEAEVRQVFQATLAVRNLSPEAKELADRYFFETLVRLHRAGEGAPYTGLKPAGRDLGPAIPAADRALEDGSMEKLKALLTDAMQRSLRKHYEQTLTKKRFRTDDLAAGREYVEAYVEFVHYVERIHEASTMPAQGHFHEPGAYSENEMHAEHQPQSAIDAEAEHR